MRSRVCGTDIAPRDENESLKTAMVNLYGTTPGETQCLGCIRPDLLKKFYGFSTKWAIRSCVEIKDHCFRRVGDNYRHSNRVERMEWARCYRPSYGELLFRGEQRRYAREEPVAD